MFSIGRLVPRIANICRAPRSQKFTTTAIKSAGISTYSDGPIKSATTAHAIIKAPGIIPLDCPLSRTSQLNLRFKSASQTNWLSIRHFHAADSKVKYLDFRYRFKIHHLRLNLLIIRRRKMRKHKLRKWRKKFKSSIAKRRLKREIAKEKAFRVELLTIIRRAETFDPREYALKKIAEMNNKPYVPSKQEWYEELKEKVRVNRYQTTYIKPKHRRCDKLDLNN